MLALTEGITTCAKTGEVASAVDPRALCVDMWRQGMRGMRFESRFAVAPQLWLLCVVGGWRTPLGNLLSAIISHV